MATKTWVSNDGVWQSQASWSDNTIPTDGDTVIFDGSSTMSVLTGPTLTPDLAFLHIKDTYRGNLGSKTAPLYMQAEKVWHYGHGLLAIKHPANAVCLELRVDTEYDEDDALYLTSVGSDDNVCIYVKRGRAHISADVNDIDWLAVGYHDNPPADAYVYLADSANELQRVIINGGIIDNYRQVVYTGSVGQVNVCGGTFYQWGTRGVQHVTVGGGSLIYNSTGTLQTGYLAGGLTDFTQSAGTKTVGGLLVFEGADLLYDDNTTIAAGNGPTDMRNGQP